MNLDPDKLTKKEEERPIPVEGEANESDESANEDAFGTLSTDGDEAPAVALEEPILSYETFEDAALEPELLEAINKLGWKNPTKIQSMCLPYTVHGKDLAGFAQTGTGKTGVFIISIAQRVLTLRKKSEGKVKQPIAIVLSPTRELAMQIESDAHDLFNAIGIKSLAVFGGVDYEKQARMLTEGTDVVVATPGRLKDFTQKRVLDIKNCQIFVCDEADRMFDMGFIDDVKFFFDLLVENSQRLLFSATTNDNVKELAFEYLDKPRYISATPESITPENIEQQAIICDAQNKLKVMLGLLREHKPACAIVFANTKIAAEWLHLKLNGNGFETDLITGDLPQRRRISLIKRIKDGEVKALIATDVASRGLHIAGVTHVYNFDLPDDPSNYVHRIGRTARAGAKGRAISLVCEDYGDNLRAINELLGPLALKATWYDPSFSEIEDKAGDPFQGQQRSRSGGGKKREGGDSRDSRGPRRDNRGPRREGQQQGGRDRKPHQGNRPDRSQNGEARPRRHDQKPRHPQPNRAPDPNRPLRPEKYTTTKKIPEPVVVAQPKGFFGLVKKIVSTLFKK